MKDKVINWSTVTTRRPQLNQQMHYDTVDAIAKLYAKYPSMYSYKNNADDKVTKYQFIEPVLEKVQVMINPKDERIEIWIPLKPTDDEPLEV